ncbi:MAG TPA: VWA domain-containing protein [Bryobacteraceae bacterium]|nr:VWA domain-containing protein [Bryobacteraceae bacterium]
MTFLHPEYLKLGWVLLALAVWCGFSLRSLQQARRRLGGALYNLTSRPSSLARRGAHMLLLVTVLGCLVLALARPQRAVYHLVAGYRHIDAVILLDASPSMRARDIEPSRLVRSTEVIGSFLGKKPAGDRIGLISFAENALVLSYLTADTGNILFYLDYLRDRDTLQYGTNIGGALKSAMTLFTRQGEREPESRGNKKVVILLSDGEDHGEELKSEMREMAGRGIPAYCIGIGSQQGVPVPISATEYLTGPGGAPILTTFEETTLQDIAGATGGRYYRARTATELDRAFQDIFVKAREIAGYRHVRETREDYGTLLGAAFVLALIRWAS